MPHIFPPSRGETRWRAAGYAFIVVLGFWVMWDTLTGYDTDGSGWQMNEYARVIWSLFLLTAIPTAISVLRGRYRIEAVLLPIFGSAIAVAILNAFIRLLEGDGGVATRLFITCSCFCFMVVRGLQLHRVVKGEPWPMDTTSRT